MARIDTLTAFHRHECRGQRVRDPATGPPPGANVWLRVRGFISTIGKIGLDVLTAIIDTITGNPWQPIKVRPSSTGLFGQRPGLR